MTVYLPLIIALIGLIVYLVSSNPKVARIGEMMLFSGLLAFLLQANQLVRLI